MTVAECLELICQFLRKNLLRSLIEESSTNEKIIIFPCSKICFLFISKSFLCPALSFTFAVLLCTATALHILHILTFSCRIYSTRKMDSIEGEDTLQIWLQHYNSFFHRQKFSWLFDRLSCNVYICSEAIDEKVRTCNTDVGHVPADALKDIKMHKTINSWHPCLC